MKLFLLILLPYFAWRRQWSSAAFFIAGVVAAFTLGLIVAGPHAFSSWLSALKEQTWQGQALSMSLLGGATRALQPSTEFRPLVERPSAVLPVWLAASVLVSLFAAWRLRAERNSDRDLAAILTLMLLPDALGLGLLHSFGGRTPGGRSGRVLEPDALVVDCWRGSAPVSVSLHRSRSAIGVGDVTVGSLYMWGGLLVTDCNVA